MFSNDLLDNITPEEYAEKNIELHAKYSDNVELNTEEVDFFCACTKFENLLDFPMCTDEYFKRIFLASRANYPRDFINITDKDRVYYEGFVKEWDLIISKKDHSNELLQITAKETRQELKNFRKNYSFQDNYSWDKYIQGKNTIIEWSKYRYIFIKKIFDIKIKASEFDLILNKCDEEDIFT